MCAATRVAGGSPAPRLPRREAPRRPTAVPAPPSAGRLAPDTLMLGASRSRPAERPAASPLGAAVGVGRAAWQAGDLLWLPVRLAIALDALLATPGPAIP